MIYKKIVKYCEENKISITALEKKCGIGNGTIGKWADGKKPSLDTLEKIANGTGISVSEWVSD